MLENGLKSGILKTGIKFVSQMRLTLAGLQLVAGPTSLEGVDSAADQIVLESGQILNG